MITLTEQEKERYSRQILFWGIESQERLKRAKVGIIGAGGLGSPILIYLAVAGIGKLIIADKDYVELSNLNRQTLHWHKDIGKEKTASAEEKLKTINPDIEIISYFGEVNQTNIDKIFGEADVLVDALDNFPSRFLMNEYVWKKKIPFFHGAIWGLEGRVTTFIPGETCCLQCLYSESPPKEVFPVVGVTPGLTAMIQSTEVLKYFTGRGRLLLNRLLIYEGETMKFREISLKKDSSCKVCGVSKG